VLKFSQFGHPALCTCRTCSRIEKYICWTTRENTFLVNVASNKSWRHRQSSEIYFSRVLLEAYSPWQPGWPDECTKIIAQNEVHSIFLAKVILNLFQGKRSPPQKNTSSVLQLKVNKTPNRQKFVEYGHPVLQHEDSPAPMWKEGYHGGMSNDQMLNDRMSNDQMSNVRKMSECRTTKCWTPNVKFYNIDPP
jgi:hypothetical protein